MKLNVQVDNLFEKTGADVGVDFVAPNQQLPNDYMDEAQSDAARNSQTVTDFRKDWAERIDWDNASGTMHGKDDDNPGQQTAPYGQLVESSKGFNNKQAHKNIIMGVVANKSDGTLVGGRVVVEKEASKVRGTVVAVGDNEFAVIWDDRIASVERKSDYELVLKG